MTPHRVKVNRTAWHLLWTIPVAFILSLMPTSYGTINICGISGCSGGGFGVSYGPEVANWIVAGVVGTLFGLAIGLVPWLKPTTLRIALALIVGLIMGGLLMWNWLGQKYHW